MYDKGNTNIYQVKLQLKRKKKKGKKHLKIDFLPVDFLVTTKTF